MYWTLPVVPLYTCQDTSHITHCYHHLKFCRVLDDALKGILKCAVQERTGQK